MDLSDRIGVSTISLPGVTAEHAVDAIAEAGFKSIEILCGVATHSPIGNPDLMKPSSACWPRDWDHTRREALRDKLRQFGIVTVHAQLEGINIASWNPGIREESVKQYLECIDFAHDIGASICTFHPHSTCRYPQYERMHKHETHEYNLAFAHKAIDHARSYDLQLGFEGVVGAGAYITDVVLQAPEKEFGILIDPAQSTLRQMTCDELIEDMRRCKGRILELHVHGSLCRSVGVIAHFPLRLNNIVDWRVIMAVLRELDFRGPFMFEIDSSEDYRQILRDCQESRQLLLDFAQAPPP